MVIKNRLSFHFLPLIDINLPLISKFYTILMIIETPKLKFFTEIPFYLQGHRYPSISWCFSAYAKTKAFDYELSREGWIYKNSYFSAPLRFRGANLLWGKSRGITPKIKKCQVTGLNPWLNTILLSPVLNVRFIHIIRVSKHLFSDSTDWFVFTSLHPHLPSHHPRHLHSHCRSGIDPNHNHHPRKLHYSHHRKNR